MNRVSVLRVKSNLHDEVERLIRLVGGEGIISPGDTVLLKPNLHAIQSYKTGGTTNPLLVEALVKWAYRQGAKEVIVGDSPFYGCAEPERCFTDTGMGEIVERAGARWVTFTRHNFRIFRDISPLLPELGISEFVFDCDRMINIPVMKTHCDCLVTLGMKNLKGCIRNRDKSNSHRIDVNRVVVELNKLIRPDLTVVDGTVGMEGMGPASGTPVNCNLLIAGKDIVAVDSVAAFLMGIEPEEVMTIKLGHEAGLGEMNLDGIEVVGEELERIRMRWKRPDLIIAERFPWLRMRNNGACSGCNINLFKALDELDRAGERMRQKMIVMGRDTPMDRESLLIGRCTSSFWKDYDHLPGCPPKVEAIREFLRAS